jgi:formylglycine-generating enzyme required for sulfatase activity
MKSAAKQIRWLIIGLCALAMGAAVMAQGVAVVVLPAIRLEVEQSATIEAQIVCTNAVCNGFEMTLTFDPAVVRVDDVRPGAYLGANVRVVERLRVIDNEAGTASLVALTTPTGFAPPPGENRFIQITLTAVGAGESPLELTRLQMPSAGVQGVSVAGSVTVTAPVVVLPTASPTPSATPTPSITPTPDFAATAVALATGTQVAINNMTQIALSFTPTPHLAQTQAYVSSATAFARLINQQVGYSAERPVTRVGQWTPTNGQFDGVLMVLVPAGCFTMGSDAASELIRPAHYVCIDKPFWIDVYEVSNEQFERLGGQAALESTWTRPSRPRENITWFEARDYCNRRGGRLPTEAEWEFAARGPGNPLYPWGDLVINNNMTFIANSGGQTADVTSRLDGRAWVGALNMSGNVWEWTSTLWQGYPYRGYDGREGDALRTASRVIRGGSFRDYETGGVQPQNRGFDRSNSYAPEIGVRCVRDFDFFLFGAPEPTLTPPPGFGIDNPIGRNRDWQPLFESIGGVEMALVPAGCTYIGSDVNFDERPLHQVCFSDPFWIDRYEVTNAQWEEFGGVSPRRSSWTGDTRPRERISWFEARDFCERRGARLPTEAEWEYAARGPDSLIYPWGNEFNRTLTVFAGTGSTQTANVGSIPRGASWVGALDMSGNVWEWTSSIYNMRQFPYPYAVDSRENLTETNSERVARGGSFAYVQTYQRTAYRFHSNPALFFDNFGVRCARDFDRDGDTSRFSPLRTPAPTPTPTFTPTFVPEDVPLGLSADSPITFNARWTPVIQEFDGVPMALVPAGCYQSGSEDGDLDEWQGVQRCFNLPFWIDRDEVSSEQFERLGGTTAYPPAFDDAMLPRTNMTYFEARDFCHARGLRLPTEWEWEYAARGPDRLIYPWGNTFEAENAVLISTSNKQPRRSGSRSDGMSWVGALDLAGNVWEWTSSIYDFEFQPRRTASERDSSLRVIRGGGWDSIAYDLRTSERNWESEYTFNERIGFRCVRAFIGESTVPTQPPLGLSAENPVTRNSAWVPVVRSFGDFEMMLVPAGCFTMGSTNGDSDEAPTARICFDQPFWIDRNEITNGDFTRLITGTSLRPVANHWAGEDRPRENVTWAQAQAFCQLRGAELPTEAEWEYAARGPSDLEYALTFTWGDRYRVEDIPLIYDQTSFQQTAPAGTRPGGESWVGAVDLTGNVSEWTLTAYNQFRFPYPYRADDGRNDPNNQTDPRVIRGGNWAGTRYDIRAANREWQAPGVYSNRVGFRCILPFGG